MSYEEIQHVVHTNQTGGLVGPPEGNWQQFVELAPEHQTGAIMHIVAGLVERFGTDYCDPNSLDGNTCQYMVDGAPSCIVGQVLWYLGYPHMGEVVGSIVEYARRWVYLRNHEEYGQVSKHAVIVLCALQGVQDAGGTWQVAMAGAEQTRNALIITA